MDISNIIEGITRNGYLDQYLLGDFRDPNKLYAHTQYRTTSTGASRTLIFKEINALINSLNNILGDKWDIIPDPFEKDMCYLFLKYEDVTVINSHNENENFYVGTMYIIQTLYFKSGKLSFGAIEGIRQTFGLEGYSSRYVHSHISTSNYPINLSAIVSSKFCIGSSSYLSDLIGTIITDRITEDIMEIYLLNIQTHIEQESEDGAPYYRIRNIISDTFEDMTLFKDAKIFALQIGNTPYYNRIYVEFRRLLNEFCNVFIFEVGFRNKEPFISNKKAFIETFKKYLINIYKNEKIYRPIIEDILVWEEDELRSCISKILSKTGKEMHNLLKLSRIMFNNDSLESDNYFLFRGKKEHIKLVLDKDECLVDNLFMEDNYPHIKFEKVIFNTSNNPMLGDILLQDYFNKILFEIKDEL